jgi:hypothetical protein
MTKTFTVDRLLQPDALFPSLQAPIPRSSKKIATSGVIY